MRRESLSAARRSRPRIEQLTIFRRGAKRRGAGRNPKGEKALVAHTQRESFSNHEPVHVTTRLRAGLSSLRQRAELAVVSDALAAATDRFGFRVVHFSVQSNHLHPIVEAEHAHALGRGMKGLLVRIARAHNRLWKRSGSVFGDRYHTVVLRTLRQVRNALVYVLNNARKHGIFDVDHHDPCSSGDWFDGWIERRCARIEAGDARSAPVWGRPRSWLLRRGWRKHGLIRTHELPRS